MSWDQGHMGDGLGSFGGEKTTLWMGDLEPWMDEPYIKQLWYSLGETVNVKMIRDRATGGNAGYCFVDFVGTAAAMKALNTVNGTVIPGTTRVFKLNWASGGGLNDRRDMGPEYSIFVGDLDPTVTDYMLFRRCWDKYTGLELNHPKSLFQGTYVSCKSAKVVTDPHTGQARGYGFVRFYDEAEAQRAIHEMQGVMCGSRAMRISIATPKNRVGGAPMQTPMQGQGGYYGGQGQGGQPSDYDPFNDPHNTTVFVGGITAPITDEDLRNFFAHYGEIVYTKVPPGKGCGFVQFAHRQSAEMAINQMHGSYLGGSRVRLSWGRSQAISKPADFRPAPTGFPASPASAGPFMGAAGVYPGVPVPPPVTEDPRIPIPVEQMNAAYIQGKTDLLVRTELETHWREAPVQ
ncbi:hypothetical protein HK104_010873 [Borealophlyctis nickersoniae]|nr:hypothetical protein HK104_010873 [Borealophlyctis nickersoniae]